MRYFYISPDDYKKGEENGICNSTVYTRVRKYGWDVDKAITEPLLRRRFTELEEERMKQLGVKKTTVLYWIHRNMTVEEAIKRAMRGPQRIFNEEQMKEFKERGVVPYNVAKQRYRRYGWSFEDSITVPTLSRSEVCSRAGSKSKRGVAIW